MDSWFDRGDVPATRYELRYGDRIVRCFVERPRSVHAMLEGAVARRPHATALICGDERVSYRELDDAVGRVAAGLRALGVRKRRPRRDGAGEQHRIRRRAVCRRAARRGVRSAQYPAPARREPPHPGRLRRQGRRARARSFRPRSLAGRPGQPGTYGRRPARRRRAAGRAARRGARHEGRAGRRGRDRDHPLHLRHHRKAEGGDADAFQHRPFGPSLRASRWR